MDCFYKILNRKQHEQAERNEYNFDHPDAFDFELMLDVITKLKEGRKVEVPVYNFVTHAREATTKTMYGANVIIFEGILTFHSAEVLEMLDMKIFVDTDSDIRLARRLKRCADSYCDKERIADKIFTETSHNEDGILKVSLSNIPPW
jgi:uridine kinase